MTVVMIGVDPHKGSHTAVAIGSDEEPLGRVRVRASVTQAQRLVTWAADWPERTWAVEGAGGLGHLLAQQLVAAGERVLDVQPRLGSRVRLPAGRRPPRRSAEPGRATGEPLAIQGGRLTPRPPALRASHSRACHPPYDPCCFLSRAAAISCERVAGSRTGRSPAAPAGRPRGRAHR
jgi:hypothetical protein